MTDDDSRDDAGDESRDESRDETSPDERDERVASLLEVPPLDEVTRRRLVTRALAGGDARPRSGSRRLLVPAAAALVVLVLVTVGALVLVTRDDGDGGTAARSTPASGAPQDRRPSGEATGSPPAGISDLGDLGELGETADLRRRVGDALRDPAPIERTTAPVCLDRALTGSPAPTAFGTGTHGGRPVLVLVLPARAERMTAVLLDQETCRAVSVVDIF
jgi:hypothetical protein